MTTFPSLITTLNRQSVAKHHDAFLDVAWDADPIRPDDPRWELGPDEPLGASEWYRALPTEERARIGLHVVVCRMKVGWQFENVLARGLLLFAATQPDGSPEVRYAHHELIEEAQHMLMFREFVARAGLEAWGIHPTLRKLEPLIARTASWFPELFFLFVLGGEEPIDAAQRRALLSGRELHPLIARILQIHTMEEARHVAFARAFVRERVPALGVAKRAALRAMTPVFIDVMERVMLGVPGIVRETYGVPSIPRADGQGTMNKLRELCAELEIS
jgi:hypothetical protein